MKSDNVKRWALKVALAMCAAFVFAQCLEYSGWPGLVAGVVTFIGSVLGLHWMFERYEGALQTRINAINPLTWEVKVNGVTVGSITDSEYALMKLHTFRDGGTAIAQLGNLTRVLVHIVDRLVVSIPIMMFWGLVALAVFAPESYTDLLAEVQKAGPAGVAAAAKQGLQVITLAAVMGLGLSFIFGARLGFVNYYADAVARMLREHFSVPAEGTVSLTCWDVGTNTMHFASDVDTAWARRDRRR